MIRTVTLAATLLAPTVAPGQPPPIPRPASWSAPVDGIALGLVVAPTRLQEASDPDRDHDAAPRFHVHIKNASRRKRRIVVPVLHADLSCLITRHGTKTRFEPTFYPPPMPRPGDRPRAYTVAPGDSMHYATMDSISGFREAGRPRGRWYRALPAGSYTVRVAGTVGGVKGRLTSRPASLKVLRADQPVDGLRLAVQADRIRTRVRPDGRDIVPITLRLTFHNVGKRALGLDLHALARRSLRLEVSGPSTSQVDAGAASQAAPKSADRPTLAPGRRLAARSSLSFPGDFGGLVYQINRPGWYQLRLSYEQRQRSRCGANDCWTGRVHANLLWLQVLPAR
jgi:hypothetical protein